MSSDRAPDVPAPADTHPDRIGGYRLLRVLGEGGMGVVYLAEQLEPVRREVALKVLKPGMDTRQIVARFAAERQALAVMEHPGIAHVFDAGVTEAGRPFFVMERVDGVPITEYCDAQRLDVRARIRLFAMLCRAVQHAHQKGVIHRDLKPSNVLVTAGDGAALCKIIDFGIAKAIQPDDSAATRLTHVDQSPGTPAYMSPEQIDAAGRDIDTRSDIYSLGVLLYELLAGVLPFDADAYRGWALIAQQLARDAPAPSARFHALEPELRARIAEQRQTDPAGLRRALRGELDWIVGRALEKERERRYETATGLAIDLDRFLADEPVSAGPPSRAYRARKFVRRNRIGVVFAAVLAFVLVGFAGAMGVQAERVARARDLAVARQGQAEDLIGFMVGDLRAKLTPVGRLDILDDVGQRALAYFAAVPEAELSDEELFRRAIAIRQLGEVRLDQGKLEAANEAFGEALGLMGRLAARDPRNGEWQLALAEAHFWAGDVQRRQGDLDGARREFETYRDIAQALVRRDSSNIAWRQELAYANSHLGNVAYARRDLDAAIEAWQRRLTVQQWLVAQDTTDRRMQLDLSNAHNLLGVALDEAGFLEAAHEHLSADVRLKRRLLELEPENTVWLGRLGRSLSYLARSASGLGRPHVALDHYREELAVWTALVSHDPNNAVWLRNLATSRVRVGLGLLERGELTAATPLIEQALVTTLELAAANPAQQASRIDLGNRHRDMAQLALARGRPGESHTAASRSITVLDSILVETPDNATTQRFLAQSYVQRGMAWQAIGQVDSAATDWTRAVELLAPHAAAREYLVLDPLARALLLLGRHDEADHVLQRLEEIGYRERTFLRFIGEHRGQITRTTR
jgi:eukaryotic-like serine/threonine-protein kinase